MYEGSVGVCVNGMEGHGDRKDGDIGERSIGEELSGFLDDLFQGSPAGDNTAIHNGNLLPSIFFDVNNRCDLHIAILLTVGVLSIKTTTYISDSAAVLFPTFGGGWESRPPAPFWVCARLQILA